MRSKDLIVDHQRARSAGLPVARKDNREPSRREPLTTVVDRLPGPAISVFTGLCYLALAQFVIWLNNPVLLGAGFWPAAGLSLALLLLLPTRRWVWVIAGIAAAEFGGDLLHGYPAGAASFWTFGNCIEPLVGAYLIRRFAQGNGILAPLSQLFRFIMFGVVVGPLFGATIGSLGTIIFFDSGVWTVWPKYLVGDALGVLVLAPVLLCWLETPSRRSLAERSLIVTSSILVTLLVFRNWDGGLDVTLPYLIVPFLTWAGLRFGVRGVAMSSFAIGNVANWATANGYGPFAITGATEHAVTLLQLFLGITITASLMLAAVVSDLTDRHAAERELQARNDDLAGALQELSESKLHLRKLEGILPICMSCKAVRTDDDKGWVQLDEYLMRSNAVSLSHSYCPNCEKTVLVDA